AVSCADAAPAGILVEPPGGIPEFGPILDAVAAFDPDICAIVEQDMPGCAPDAPYPSAVRTKDHILGCSHHARVR
ncbi:MAG: 2-keto-myo-inositol dehydratase, partial [Beutenbergiaceae bacterium]